jgi:transcriptional regulator with XRE-family HTH domain
MRRIAVAVIVAVSLFSALTGVAQIEEQTKVPSLATLEKLAKALNVKVGRLLE